MTRNSLRLCRFLAPLAALCVPFAADAHIQWFANVDLSGDPLSPWDVMTNLSFAGIALLALVVLAFAGAADAWLTRAAGRHGLIGRLHRHDMGVNGLTLMRFGMAIFFIANVLFFRDAPVILTPELKTSSPLPDVLQVAIAGALLLGRMRLAAGGLLALFAYGAMGYGVFHVMAYPIFLGIAVYLALAGAGPVSRARALVVLRVAVAVSLMWGGIEKWLFPQWTYPLLCGSGKALTMGLPPDFFMQAAGFIEFCLAFVLLVGSLASRVAAIALNVVFAAAIPMFGMVDVIGHAPFMLALVVLGRTPNTLAPWFGHVAAHRQGLRWGAKFAGALGALPALYFLGHQFAFGRLTVAPLASATLTAVVLSIVGVALGWVLVRLVGGQRTAGGF